MSYKGDYIPPYVPSYGVAGGFIGPLLIICGLALFVYGVLSADDEEAKAPITIENSE